MLDPHIIRWGILATGGIAQLFTKDLLLDPASRQVTDVRHQVVAIASSSSTDRAKQFVRDCNCAPTTKTYGSYEELVADKDVQVVYVATPHSHHYQNVMLCLNAGKHVLCEKAFTVNAAQARRLYTLAKEKNLFLMEAVWTRYFPLSIQIRSRIRNGEIGEVYRVIADNSFGDDVENKYGTKHRMTNLNLAGGAMLDLGIYSLTWCFQTLYHTLPPADRKPPKVLAAMNHFEGTGADEQTSIILSFENGPGGSKKHPAQAIALTGLRAASDPDSKGGAGSAIRIQGSEGEIQVFPPAYRPTKYSVILKTTDPGRPTVQEFSCEIPGHGMFWEADEVARCLRDGRLESETIPWEESVVIMETMDEARRQGGLIYPRPIETLDYPVALER